MGKLRVEDDSDGRTSPISAKDLSRLHQFGKKVLPGICLGYVFYAGGIWKGGGGDGRI